MRYIEYVYEFFSIYECVGVVYFGKGKDVSTIAVKLVSHRKLFHLYLGFSVSLQSAWRTSKLQQFISWDPEVLERPTKEDCWFSHSAWKGKKRHLMSKSRHCTKH